MITCKAPFIDLFYLFSDTANPWLGRGRSGMKYINSDDTKSCRNYTKTDINEHIKPALAGTTRARMQIFLCPQPDLVKRMVTCRRNSCAGGVFATSGGSLFISVIGLRKKSSQYEVRSRGYIGDVKSFCYVSW